MLELKRITMQYEVMKCKISNEMIVYGDYYYEDSEDGLIVKASVYHEYKKRERENRFDYSALNKAASAQDYSNMLKEAELQYLQQTLMNRKVIHNGEIQDGFGDKHD